jgi:hypothetical protein
LHVTHRTTRTLLSLACALACIALLPAGASAVVVGIGDNGTEMFSDPLFQALNVHQGRVQVSWNVAVSKSHRGELGAATAWLQDARQAGITPLVTFAGSGNYVPTVKQYTAAVKAFIKRFPWVKNYTPWNEPDWIYRSLSRKPSLAASYFNALFVSCHRCTVLAGDVYLSTKRSRWTGSYTLATWLRAYIKGLHHRPGAWALHNYDDVRTHTTSQLTTLQKLTSGPIWLDEIAGIEHRGHWQYRNESVAAAARDEQFLFSLPKRFHRVARIYHYQWLAGPADGWDSGLIASDGTPRAAYDVVMKAAQ